MTAKEFIAYCDGIEYVKDENINRKDIEEKIAVSICNLTSMPVGEIQSKHIWEIRKGIIYLSILEGDNKYKLYYDILDVLISHTGSKYKIMSDWSSQECIDTIRLIKQSLDKYPKTDGFLKEDLYHHERERARAALNLKSYGVEVNVDGNDLVFTHEEKAFKRIEELAHMLGGMSIISCLIAPYNVHPYHKRIMIPYQGNQPMPSMVDVEMPWGLIFYLAQKYLGSQNNGLAGQDEYDELIQLAKDYTLAIYDVQKFDYWEDLFHNSKNLIQHVRTLIDRHILFTFPQCYPDFAHDWCRFIIEKAKKHKRCTQDLKNVLNEFSFIELFFYHKSLPKTFGRFNIKIINKLLMHPISNQVYKHIISDIHSLNQNYSNPTDYKNVDGWKYPLLIDNDIIYSYPSSIGAWNWYEALLLIIKDYDDLIIKDFGHNIEDFIIENLSAHHIMSHTGTYSYQGENGKATGEADILIESKKLDMLLECKKKVLTGSAKAGSDISAWIDLSDSLVESQYQCARTEYAVKSLSELNLYDKETNTSYKYIWRPQYEDGDEKNKTTKRYVEKITLTLNSYGFLQDRVLLPSLLEEMIGKEFNVDFSGFEKEFTIEKQKNILLKFKHLNDNLSKIAWFNNQLGEKHPMFHCRFLSLEMLYYKIKSSNGNDDFCQKASGKFISTGTQDFWTEDLYIEKM